MSVDLKLLPCNSNSADFSSDVLGCARDEDLFDKVRRIVKKHGRLVPDNFMSYLSEAEDRDEHFGLSITDKYGGAGQIRLRRRSPHSPEVHQGQECGRVGVYLRSSCQREDRRLLVLKGVTSMTTTTDDTEREPTELDLARARSIAVNPYKRAPGSSRFLVRDYGYHGDHHSRFFLCRWEKRRHHRWLRRFWKEDLRKESP